MNIWNGITTEMSNKKIPLKFNEIRLLLIYNSKNNVKIIFQSIILSVYEWVLLLQVGKQCLHDSKTKTQNNFQWKQVEKIFTEF